MCALQRDEDLFLGPAPAGLHRKGELHHLAVEANLAVGVQAKANGNDVATGLLRFAHCTVTRALHVQSTRTGS
jgi:hypothetical protein